MNDNEPIVAKKKNWQQPNFWVIDSYIAGGAGANVHEGTARTTGLGLPAHAGQPSRQVHKAGFYGAGSYTANWTAAHS